jgi:diamine N-acetyltransferase
LQPLRRARTRALRGPNSVSIAEAYFSEKAWFQAIYADETPVGFLMLYDDPQKPEYYLWRFMIADSHQGKGYARRAMELLIEHVRRRPTAEEMVLSYVPGEGSPEGFYRGLGFEPTGKVDEGEIVMALRFNR